MGQMETKCIFNIGKNISILAKVTQVSDVAHGPLVTFEMGLTAGATGQQGILTPPRHLIPPPVYPGVCVGPFIFL
jgi:hypothetical protein